MSYCLPVLQYETDPPPDDAGAPASPAPANNEQYAAPARSQERGQHQQPGPSSKHRSSKPGAAVKGASSKPSKKEQQQAQERPDVGLRPDVMQKLSKERRKRAFIGMLRLLEHGAKDSSELQMLVAPMSDEELLQVAQERSLAGRCGNPLCKQPFEPERASSKYSLSAGELHPVEAIEGDCYCSKSCSSFTQQLAAQLVNPMDRIKPSALHKALEAPSHKPQKPQQQGVGAQGGGVTTMKSVIEERPAYQLIHEAESAGKRLDEAAAAVGGDSTAAAAVEGYIPRQAPDTQPKRQQAQAGPQQQQKQEQGSSAAGDEATAEVLQLNPVLNEHPGGQQAAAAAAAGTVDAAATAATTAAAGGGGGGSKAAAADVDAAAAGGGGGLLGSSDELQQYLQVFREHQEKKLQQINQRQPADTNGTADKQQGHTVKPQQQQQQQQMHQQQQGELPQPEGSQKQRKVRFAPDIEYSCPADPVQHHQEQEQQQPVLTFTMLDGDSSSRRGRSGTAGGSSGDMVGELHLTTVDELEPDLQAAAAGEGAAGDSGNGQQQQQQQQELSEAWKLFLPPALGGIGVPVKQVIVEGPENGSAAKPQQRQQRGRQLQQQQQQGSTLQQRQQQEKQACPAAGAAAAAPAPSSKSSKGAVSVAVALATAARPAEPAAKRNAAATPAAAAAGGAGAGAGSAAPASKLRKFAPLVKPRRSVVMLDEVPGVTLQQRGVRPSAAAATAAASAAAAAAGPAAASQAAAPSVQPATASNGSSSTASASTSTNGVNSSSSSSSGGGINSSSSKGRNQVVHIGPLRHTPSLNSSSSSRPDQQQSPGDDNGSGSDNSSGGGSDSDDGAMSDVSSQEEWYPELNTGNSSSRNSTRPQRNSSNSTNGNRNPAATAVAREDGGVPWDSGSESGGDAGGGSEAGDSLQEGEGSDGSGYGLEDMMSSAAGALDSLLPFFDTRGITVSLSEFGLVWNHLHSWVSPATVAYVGDRGAGEDGSSSGGTSYGVSGISGISSSIGTAAVSPPAAAAAADGGGAGVTAAAASEQQGSTSAAVTQQRTALVNLLSAALPPVVQQLNIPVLEAQISKQLSALVRSFYLPPGPLPALQPRQWQLLVTLMLAALAAWRLPVLRPVFKRQQQCEGSGSALGVWVQQLGTDLDRFWALMDLFELRV